MAFGKISLGRGGVLGAVRSFPSFSFSLPKLRLIIMDRGRGQR